MDDAGDTASLKEIQDLLENADQSHSASWKKYARLVLPHVGLVTVVCIYAMVGAWVFYSLESPHEDRLKVKGVHRIYTMRKELTEMVWERHEQEMEKLTRDEWKARLRHNLQLFNENLYRAYKDQYVRYGDVRITKKEPLAQDPRVKRHRSSKSRSEKGGKLWTASSSLFFAATTMATIGYGNIVPVTNHGRIACIVFALFGAPLAIITIGDLGKFLSECTIWLYRKIKEKSRLVRYQVKMWTSRKQGVVSELDRISSGRTSGTTHSNMGDMSEWDDLDKAEVPVLLVFAILLLYIAFGGVLFAVLESWTYMDAFYYCFVSLTTIGFGDLVPDRHEYIVLMLVYLGVGLAVTTMCIDLVGIQYIQKIHYFGRKFKGTDILQILRRKRMLERRFAMGEGKDFIEYVIQVTQENKAYHPASARSVMPPVKVASQFYSMDNPDEKLSLQSEKEMIVPWSLDDILVDTTPLTQLQMAQKAPTPDIISARSLPPPSIEDSSNSDRTLMYEKWTARSAAQGRNSWTESGPDLSIHCSISTAPSVQERELIYNNFRSPSSSVLSFKFSFPLPSPDLHRIAEASRNARRVHSCPSIVKHMSSPSSSSHSSSSLRSSPIGLTCMEQWESYSQMLEEYNKPAKIRSPEPVPTVVCPPPAPITPPPPEPEPPSLQHNSSLQQHLQSIPTDNSHPLEPHFHTAIAMPSTSQEVVQVDLVTQPLDPCHVPPLQVLGDVHKSEFCLPSLHTVIPEVEVEMDVEDEPEEFMEELSQEEALIGSPSEEGQTMQLPASLLSRKTSIAPPPLKVLAERMVIEQEFEDVISPLFPESSSEEEDEGDGAQTSSSKSLDPVFDLDLGAFELVDSGVTAEVLLSQEDPVIYHKDMPVHSVHHDTVQTEAAIENLMNAPQSMLSNVVPPTMVADNYCFVVDGDSIKMNDIMGDEQWWRHTSRPTKFFYSEDMRRFYKVNCLSARGRIIGARLAQTTPAMGGSAPGGPAGSSNQAWNASIDQPESPTKSRLHSYSSGRDSIGSAPALKSAVGGVLAGATGSGSYPGTALQSYATTPRSSMAYQPVRCEVGQRGERVDLSNVYKVVRFYSFWKTCTSFHRIVTMIEKVKPGEHELQEEGPGSGPATRAGTPTVNFRKRLFVQYLWRNAKIGEKSRVQKEFDPRRQRLLQFVTDTAARKRMTGAVGNWRGKTDLEPGSSSRRTQ